MLVYRLIVGLFVAGFGAKALWKEHRLGQDGVVAQAVITYVSTAKKSLYPYRFSAKGQYYSGFAHDNPFVGETLNVKYVPDDPAINKAVVSTEIEPGWLFFCVGAALIGASFTSFKRGGRPNKVG